MTEGLDLLDRAEAPAPRGPDVGAGGRAPGSEPRRPPSAGRVAGSDENQYRPADVPLLAGDLSARTDEWLVAAAALAAALRMRPVLTGEERLTEVERLRVLLEMLLRVLTDVRQRTIKIAKTV